MRYIERYSYAFNDNILEIFVIQLKIRKIQLNNCHILHRASECMFVGCGGSGPSV